MFVVDVSSMGAKLEQVRQELGLIDCNDTEAAVLASQRVPQICQTCCGIAGLHKAMLNGQSSCLCKLPICSSMLSSSLAVHEVWHRKVRRRGEVSVHARSSFSSTFECPS